jgi:hypothetical protein
VIPRQVQRVPQGAADDSAQHSGAILGAGW